MNKQGQGTQPPPGRPSTPGALCSSLCVQIPNHSHARVRVGPFWLNMPLRDRVRLIENVSHIGRSYLSSEIFEPFRKEYRVYE